MAEEEAGTSSSLWSAAVDLVSENLHFALEGVVLGAVCAFGVVANSAATYTLLSSSSRRQLDLSPTFARLLAALMCFDALFLAGLACVFTFPLVLGRAYTDSVYPLVVPYVLPVIQIALTGSVYMTMSLSVERYLSIKAVVDMLEECNNAAAITSSGANSNNGSDDGGSNCNDGAAAAEMTAAEKSGGWWRGDRRPRWWPSSSAINCKKMKPESAASYIVPICVFSVLYNVSRFFELKTVEVSYVRNVTVATDNGISGAGGNASAAGVDYVEEVVSYLRVERTDMRADPAYIRDYLLITNLVFMAVVPLAVLVGFNSRLYKLLRHRSFGRAGLGASAPSVTNVNDNAAAAAGTSASSRLRSRARRDRTVAATFIVVVVVFVCCHSLKLVVTFYEMCRVLMEDDEVDSWPDWTKNLNGLNHLLLAINSATNFIIYCSKDRKFRATVRRRFGFLCFFLGPAPSSSSTPTAGCSAPCFCCPTSLLDLLTRRQRAGGQDEEGGEDDHPVGLELDGEIVRADRIASRDGDNCACNGASSSSAPNTSSSAKRNDLIARLLEEDVVDGDGGGGGGRRRQREERRVVFSLRRGSGGDGGDVADAAGIALTVASDTRISYARNDGGGDRDRVTLSGRKSGRGPDTPPRRLRLLPGYSADRICDCRITDFVRIADSRISDPSSAPLVPLLLRQGVADDRVMASNGSIKRYRRQQRRRRREEMKQSSKKEIETQDDEEDTV